MTNRVITFHILLAAQFALIAVSMLVNVKTGLFSMVLILLFTAICLIQLSNDERTNWKPGQNIMTYLFIVWLLFYVAEILNPNNVMAAWNINLTPYALIPLICAFVVPVVIRTKKDVELLLIIMVDIRHNIHPKRLLAKKSWFQLQRPLFLACTGRRTHSHYMVGNPLLLLLLRCRKLWGTRCHVGSHLRHCCIFC